MAGTCDRVRGWLVRRSEILAVTLVACATDGAGPEPERSVWSVEVSPSAGAVSVNTTLQLNATPKDSSDAPLSGRGVTWSSSAATIASVDGRGLVTGTSPGAATITATSEGKSGTANVTVTPGPATHVVFTVQPSIAIGGAEIAPAVLVTARDAQGNTATGFTAAVTVAIGANPAAGTLFGTTTVTAVAGVATFSNLRIEKAGSAYTLDATSGNLTAATSTAFDITPAAADHLAFLVQPSATTAGARIAPAVQVEFLDRFENRLTAATESVSIASLNNPSGGVLSGTTATGASAGVASFDSLSIAKAGAGYSLRATANGVTSATSTPFDIRPGAADHVVFVVQPSNTTAGAPLSPAVRVEIRDRLGNRVTAALDNVTIAILDNPGGGTLSGTNAVAAIGGVATFADLSIEKDGAGYTVQATGGGLTAATSAAFDIIVSTADHVTFLAQPSTTTAGATIGPAVRVEIQDAAGNQVASANHGVTIGILDNPGVDSVSGTTTVAAVGGVATFVDLSIDKAATGYTLRASASGLAAATSTPFDIGAGSADHVAFLLQPSGAVAGTTISPAVQVEILDRLGNRVTSATDGVSIAIRDNPGGGTVSGTTTVAAASGVAVFPDLSIDKTATAYTLQASAGGLAAATSTPFAIGPSAPDHLAFLVQPSGAVAGTAISPAVQVEILDQFGNRVTSAADGVSIAILGNPGGGTLSGTNPVAAAGGVATFPDLSIDQAGIGYTLQAATGTLTTTTSVAFEITPSIRGYLAFFLQPSTTTAGATINPAVQVEILDPSGNRLTALTDSITLAIGTNPGGGTLSGIVVAGAVAGLASFADLHLDQSGLGYTLEATGSSLAASTSTPFTVTAGPVDAGQATVTAAPDTIGACLSPCLTGITASTITVTARDQLGNPVSGVAVTLNGSPSTGNRFRNPGASGVTNAGGVFAAEFSSSRVEAKTVSATVGGTVIPQTAAVAVMPVLVGAGDIADCNTSGDEATARLLDSVPGSVFTAGDNAYESGTATEYTRCYKPSWGRHRTRTRPSPGNHDYNTSGATGYFGYFGSLAGPSGRGYYSYDLGAWHMISLNSNIGMNAGSSQEKWLRTDLAATSKRCILAYWHHPRFSSGSHHGNSANTQPLWQALYDLGADVVISGHEHNYERFAPQTPSGVADPDRGIREFVVGTGGTNRYPIDTPIANSEVRSGDSWGVLSLTLMADGYRWQFIPVAGQVFSDSGSARCH